VTVRIKTIFSSGKIAVEHYFLSESNFKLTNKRLRLRSNQERHVALERVCFYFYLSKSYIKTLEDLEEQPHCAIATVTSEMLQQAQENLIRRVNMCIQIEGLHLEHML